MKLFLLNETNLKQQQELIEQRERVQMMKMLQASVSHDMMNPIGTIEMFVDEMLKCGKRNDVSKMTKYSLLINDALKLVTCRMKDLLDQNLIENNCFVPIESIFNPINAINQIKQIYENQFVGVDV